LERLKSLEGKIASAIEKVKSLKDENRILLERMDEYERSIRERDEEIAHLRAERDSIRQQVQEMLEEFETLEI